MIMKTSTNIQAFIESPIFEKFITLVIVANAIVLGLETHPWFFSSDHRYLGCVGQDFFIYLHIGNIVENLDIPMAFLQRPLENI